MFIVLYSLILKHLAGALLIFPLVWLVMRKKNGRMLEVANSRLVAGLFVTAIGAGVLQFMAIFVLGPRDAISPSGDMIIIFSIVLPILVATVVCGYIRATASTKEQRNEKAKVGLNTLMVSAADGDLGRVKELIMSGSDVNSRSESGNTALMYAVRNDHIDIVQFLLSSGADAGAASAKGTTAIAIAKEVGNPKMVECLLQHSTQQQLPSQCN